jgi:large subunit ribosomal protein L15
VVNLGRLQTAIDAGKLDGAKAIGIEELVASGVVRKARDGVRLLAKGKLKAKVEITVAGASAAAIAAVEAAGGKVTVTVAKEVAADKASADGGAKLSGD